MSNINIYYTLDTAPFAFQPVVLDSPFALAVANGVTHLGLRTVAGELATATPLGWTVTQPIVGNPRCFLEGLRLDAATQDYTLSGNQIISPYWVKNRGTKRLVVDYEY